MKTNLPRLLILLSLATRVALAAPQVPADQRPDAQRAAEQPAAAASADAGPSARSGKAHARDSASSSNQVVNGPPLSLYHGEVQVLDLADVVRLAVGNGEVLQAKVVGSQVVLIGQAAGNTSLRVWTHSGTQFTY